MTKMLTTTALIAMLAAPALAQTATTTTEPAATTAAAEGFGYTATPTDVSAEAFIGKNLYVAETEIDVNATYTEVDQSWNDIGEINDLVISETGQVQAVIVDIGGFLGLGEKSVAVSMDQLHMVRDGDSENDYFIVFTANRAALESAPEFQWPARG